MRSFTRSILREGRSRALRFRDVTRASTTRRETISPQGTATPRASRGRTSVAPCPRHPSAGETLTSLTLLTHSPPLTPSIALSPLHIHGIVTIAPRTRNVQGGAWKSSDLAPVSMKTCHCQGYDTLSRRYNDSFRR